MSIKRLDGTKPIGYSVGDIPIVWPTLRVARAHAEWLRVWYGQAPKIKAVK